MDRKYIELMSNALDATLAEFEPELVFVSAGFDCLRGDPLGGLHLEPADLHALTLLIRERCKSAGGRMVCALEGGDAPERVGLGVVDVLRALADLAPASGSAYNFWFGARASRRSFWFGPEHPGEHGRRNRIGIGIGPYVLPLPLDLPQPHTMMAAPHYHTMMSAPR